jgi:hypothetical protein
MNTDYIPISNRKLRDAVYQGFGGRCFYTGQPVLKADMAIDHIIPKNEGGKDSVFNYALTSKKLNAQKRAKLEMGMIDRMLYIVKLVYAPKVITLLGHRTIKPHQNKLNQEWRKQRKEVPRLLGELYYSLLSENGVHMDRARLDLANRISRATFGFGIPFYEGVFGSSIQVTDRELL